MNKKELKAWIQDNLIYSRGLVCKKCKLDWFQKNNYGQVWDSILLETSFLDSFNPTFPQRIWHLLHDGEDVKCQNITCNLLPTFFSYTRGYLQFCSNACAQRSGVVKEKIKKTNRSKYGVDFVMQSDVIKTKSIESVQRKYNVSNVSQVKEIQDKKMETCRKNYGTDWFLERQDLKANIVFDKYKVKNVQQVPEIVQQRIATQRRTFYNTLFNTDRLKGKCVPLFSENDYLREGLEKKYTFECCKCKSHFLGYLHDGDIPRCTTCYPLCGTSIFEIEIGDFIQSLIPNETIKKNDKTQLKNNKELDIYIPSKQLAIECNGLFWHGEFNGNKPRNYHLEKTLHCESKGIKLIHIFEDEWRDTQLIVKHKLTHILNISSSNRIYARNTEILDDISLFDKKEFLNSNHIQGNDRSEIVIGLKHKNILISLMTFSKLRVSTGNKHMENHWELSRYASHKDYHVIGGAGKLLSYFIKKYSPKKIISYADRRWTHSENNVYSKLGFKKVSNGTPNYWYFGRREDYRRFHRFGFAKHTLNKRLDNFDPLLSEWQNMQNNGWDRIWDCGNLKYEMVF